MTYEPVADGELVALVTFLPKAPRSRTRFPPIVSPIPTTMR